MTSTRSQYIPFAVSASAIGSLLAAGTVAYSLSIAAPEPWAPSSVQAQASVLYTGNSLIMDATDSTATQARDNYPFNASSASLVLPDALSENSHYFSYLVWGYSTFSDSETPSEVPSDVLLTLPNQSVINVSSLTSTVTDNESQGYTRYFIADITEYPVSQGTYTVSFPDLAESGNNIKASGWALYTAVYNPDAPVMEIKPEWQPGQVSKNSLSFGLFPDLVEPGADIDITLAKEQTRTPDSGFTGHSDIVIGESLSAHMFLGNIPQNLTSLSFPFTVSASEPLRANYLEATVKLLNPAMQEPLSIVSPGSTITVRAAVKLQGSRDIYNSEVRIKLPEYMQYQNNSLNVLLGSMNSGSLTDRDDLDVAHYDAESRTIVWHPGSTSISTSSRPHLMQREDAAQYLEFQVMLGDFPKGSTPNLSGTVKGSLSSTVPATTNSVSVLNRPISTGKAEQGSADLSVEARLIPETPLRWRAELEVTNLRGMQTPFSLTLPVPDGVIVRADTLSAACTLNKILTTINCAYESEQLPVKSSVVEYLTLILTKPVNDYDWQNVLVTSTDSSFLDPNTLNNSAMITIDSRPLNETVVAVSDSYVATSTGRFFSEFSLLDNDKAPSGYTEIVLVNKPQHGSVAISEEGSFEYQQSTRALISEETFTYALRNTVTGELSSEATVVISFPNLEGGE